LVALGFASVLPAPPKVVGAVRTPGSSPRASRPDRDGCALPQALRRQRLRPPAPRQGRRL